VEKPTIHQARLSAKPPVTVKGTRQGLLFLLDETCPFDVLESGLRDVLQGGTSSLFSGPSTPVFVDYGTRDLTVDESRTLFDIFLGQNNFIIREWAPRTTARASLFSNTPSPVINVPEQSFFKGTIRAGQVLHFEGDVVVLGDVNPGGSIVATGDIYIFGKLRGIAHAGFEGDVQAVIAAVEFAPMQLRIADYVGFAPEQDGKPMQSPLEFAYVKDGALAVDKMQFLAAYLQFRAQLTQEDAR